MAYVEGIARNQLILFPEAIDGYIEEDSPVQLWFTVVLQWKSGN